MLHPKSNPAFIGINFFEGNIHDLRSLLYRQNVDSARVFHFVAASTIAAASKNPDLLNQLRKGVCVVDSKPLHWFLKLKNKNSSHIRGTDFMRFVIFDSGNLITQFLLGSTVKNLSAIHEKIENELGRVEHINSFSPNFSDNWDIEIKVWIEEITSHDPKILWIGMGSPKQDLIAYEISKKLKIPIVTVGAAFDFISGNKREAPICWRRLGLEWFFRFGSEPRRLFIRYTKGNLIFIVIILKSIFFNHEND